MMTKEEYTKTLIRMWDSLRDTNKGENNCHGIECQRCPLYHYCCGKDDPITLGDIMNDAFDIVEIVEKWGKEHPIITNRDKFKEVFGVELYHHKNGCDGFSCTYGRCEECPYYGFWEKEYEEKE